MPQKILERLVFAIGIIVVVGLFMLASSMDYADEFAEEEHYMKMVCDGYWPNYRNLVFTCPPPYRTGMRREID